MARTAKQNEAMRDRRKEKIINRSLLLFATKGYDEVTIDDISKASKCAHGLFYHYFETKEDLYNSTVTYFETKCQSRLIQVDRLQNLKGLEAMKYVFEKYAEILKEQDQLVLYSRLALLKGTRTSTITKPLYGIDLHKEFLSFLEQGQKEGTIKDAKPQDLARIVVSILEGETSLRLVLGQEKFAPLEWETVLPLFVK